MALGALLGDRRRVHAGELRALHRPQVWLALGIGTVGFGGMFATYAYISPTMTELTGLAPGAIPLVLALYGIGMTVGALLSGRVARAACCGGSSSPSAPSP